MHCITSGSYKDTSTWSCRGKTSSHSVTSPS